MRIKDLENNHHTWSVKGNMGAVQQHKSSLHIRARELLKNKFPTLQILEEVSIPLRRGEVLYLDFYLPLKKMCIEVHGEQHYKFVAFYHANILSFLKGQKRDLEKKEWCELNSIRHIVFPYFEDDHQWAERLNNE
jgi:hypothetical protein